MEYDEHNPLRSVDGKLVKCPSSYQWKMQDISASDAGRTEDTKMDKKRIGQIRKIELEWQNVSITDAAAILQAFNPEYIEVCYLDAMTGTYRTSEFYVGDRSTPLYNAKLGVWNNVAFNIIERSGV
ncbi:DUF6711 family protein [Faecalibacterium sp. Marseille-P9590]|jgi:hypothetical protein|uniref:DUF6711 family protein n=1 Tax=Faecalibacterium sp. Marseille-P9590 TaxID=2817017 RepID=UPI001A9B65AE|nr:DUF6711 family protein [Faecalibacterium sp. Marseille-P9590]MBO1291958.1 hypothetical protein [Faecalibacterium sp. Marseille-P9590]